MNEKNFQCDLCPKILTTKSGKLEHQQLHRFFIDGVDTIKRRVREYKCLECDVIASSNTGLSTHMIAKHGHEPSKKFSCNLCDATFLLKGILTAHKDSVHNDETLICEHCNKECKNPRSLYRHIHVYHQSTRKVYTCDICGRPGFLDNPDLKLHIKTHTILNAKCLICNKTYKTENALKMHNRNIHGQRLTILKCEFCDKTFPNNSSRKKHVDQTHLDIRNFQCRKCIPT